MSHRLRGFGGAENGLQGLYLAAQRPVRYIEFDTRHTRDNVIIVYHDPHVETEYGIRLIREMDIEGLKTQRFFDKDHSIVTLEEFLRTFKSIDCQAELCIDIKDFGLETQYVDLLTRLNLVRQTWIVSWIPETLVRIHDLLPEIKLCFSHVSFVNHTSLSNISNFLFERLNVCARIWGAARRRSSFFLQRLAAIKIFYDAYNGSPDRLKVSPFAVGFRHCHILPTLPQGNLGNILNSVSGAINVPYFLVDRSFVKTAHDRGIKVWVFFLDEERKLIRYVKKVRPDVALTNNAYLIPGVKDILSNS